MKTNGKDKNIDMEEIVESIKNFLRTNPQDNWSPSVPTEAPSFPPSASFHSSFPLERVQGDSTPYSNHFYSNNHTIFIGELGGSLPLEEGKDITERNLKISKPFLLAIRPATQKDNALAILWTNDGSQRFSVDKRFAYSDQFILKYLRTLVPQLRDSKAYRCQTGRLEQEISDWEHLLEDRGFYFANPIEVLNAHSGIQNVFQMRKSGPSSTFQHWSHYLGLSKQEVSGGSNAKLRISDSFEIPCWISSWAPLDQRGNEAGSQIALIFDDSLSKIEEFLRIENLAFQGDYKVLFFLSKTDAIRGEPEKYRLIVGRREEGHTPSNKTLLGPSLSLEKFERDSVEDIKQLLISLILHSNRCLVANSEDGERSRAKKIEELIRMGLASVTRKGTSLLHIKAVPLYRSGTLSESSEINASKTYPPITRRRANTLREVTKVSRKGFEWPSESKRRSSISLGTGKRFIFSSRNSLSSEESNESKTSSSFETRSPFIIPDITIKHNGSSAPLPRKRIELKEVDTNSPVLLKKGEVSTRKLLKNIKSNRNSLLEPLVAPVV
eukprot:TRINITY_DN7942_c0_g1_i1.p1 TRINITY_DN7942_c0_g1~~TRINITY_DN7942_c0_g1_i1.p1  ORF type:complete len:570 (+),score=184.09 TRINITY_DN7942_c0_g1_i1:53-1711(+)